MTETTAKHLENYNQQSVDNTERIQRIVHACVDEKIASLDFDSKLKNTVLEINEIKTQFQEHAEANNIKELVEKEVQHYLKHKPPSHRKN